MGSGPEVSSDGGTRPAGRRPAPSRRTARRAPTIDSHTHLDACGCETDADVVAAMDRARRSASSARSPSPTTSTAPGPRSGRTRRRPGVGGRRAAPHPDGAGPAADLAEIERLAADDRVVSIGETGLDYYWDHSPPAAQQDAFRWHIGLAKRTGKPLMIHDRDAHDDVLRILREEGAPDTVVFHCFSGDAAMARECADAGYVLSFAGPVTFKRNDELRAAAAWCPPGSTSWRPTRRSSPRTRTAAGPTSPTCCRGPCAGIAATRGESEALVAETARRNAERIFRLRTTD
nr:TatD family hydrolase [Pseudonocardia sp. ICBG601]